MVVEIPVFLICMKIVCSKISIRRHGKENFLGLIERVPAQPNLPSGAVFRQSPSMFWVSRVLSVDRPFFRSNECYKRSSEQCVPAL